MDRRNQGRNFLFVPMNNNLNLTEIDVAQTKKNYPNESYIGNDLILFDSFGDVPMPTEARRMRCLFVALCTSGRAQYTVDTHRRTVEQNDVSILNEGQVVGNYLLSRDCNGLAFMMSYDFFRSVISGIHELSALFIFSRTHPVFHLSPEQSQTLKEYFFLIKKKVDDKNHHFRRELTGSLVKALIYDISNRIYEIQQEIDMDKKQTRAETIFTHFIRLVEQHFRRERRVGWYALQMNITAKYLSETVKAVSKRTPNEWIDNYVTMELSVLLKNSTLSIKDITKQMNFPNQSFLGKYFKEHVGMSPSEYRKS